MNKFTKNIQKALGYYVYGLIDPYTSEIFYIGKGSKNNRPFDHLKFHKNETRKNTRINEIKIKGKEPIIEILRYGLESEKVALEIEAALIDSIGLDKLTNIVRGHGIEKGRLTIEEIFNLYGNSPIYKKDIKEKMMMFFINRTYSTILTEIEIYDATRQYWSNVANSTRNKNSYGELDYKIALSIYDSVIIRVYKIEDWFDAGKTFSTRNEEKLKNRYEFVGNLINNHYLIGKKILNESGEKLKANQIGYGYIN